MSRACQVFTEHRSNIGETFFRDRKNKCLNLMLLESFNDVKKMTLKFMLKPNQYTISIEHLKTFLVNILPQKHSYDVSFKF